MNLLSQSAARAEKFLNKPTQMYNATIIRLWVIGVFNYSIDPADPKGKRHIADPKGATKFTTYGGHVIIDGANYNIKFRSDCAKAILPGLTPDTLADCPANIKCSIVFQEGDVAKQDTKDGLVKAGEHFQNVSSISFDYSYTLATLAGLRLS